MSPFEETVGRVLECGGDKHNGTQGPLVQVYRPLKHCCEAKHLGCCSRAIATAAVAAAATAAATTYAAAASGEVCLSRAVLREVGDSCEAEGDPLLF